MLQYMHVLISEVTKDMKGDEQTLQDLITENLFVF